MDYLYYSELYHHGIKGQKWGIRRFQNPDGSPKKSSSVDEGMDTKTMKKTTIGALKGLGITALGFTALAGAYSGTKLLRMSRLGKIGSLEDVAKVGFSGIRRLSLMEKLYPAALGAGATTGATVAYIKSKKSPKDIKEDISHSGIKGQKWGVRRYQNPDGTLTDAGKVRYNSDGSKKKVERMSNAELNAANQRLAAERNYNSLTGRNYKNRSSNTDIAIKAGVSSIGSALISVGSYVIKEKAKHPEIQLGRDKMKTAALLGILGASIGAISSVATSLGGQTNIQNIGDQKKKK